MFSKKIRVSCNLRPSRAIPHLRQLFQAARRKRIAFFPVLWYYFINTISIFVRRAPVMAETSPAQEFLALQLCFSHLPGLAPLA